MVTDRSPQFIAQEIIREQLYHQLGKELPYACAVQVETWSERADKKERPIHACSIVMQPRRIPRLALPPGQDRRAHPVPGGGVREHTIDAIGSPHQYVIGIRDQD